jgi:hypothetical protein
MKFYFKSFLFLLSTITVLSCNKNDGSATTEPARLVFKIKMDSTQTRLNNIGQPASIQAGRAAQSPKFNSISLHYFELATNATTPLGSGTVLYKAPEISTGGSMAIDFDRSIKKGEGGEYFALKLKEIPNGTYSYIRVSFAYQNMDINFVSNNVTSTGTLASFIGYNTYINNYTVKTQPQAIGANKPQGYWAFETQGLVFTGQAPAGATTVPNPIFATSPIPQGSCVVTAAFVDAAGNAKPLTIRGGEVQDLNVLLSFSTNKSFEWIDSTPDNQFEPSIGETVIDMGIRGLKPIW